MSDKNISRLIDSINEKLDKYLVERSNIKNSWKAHFFNIPLTSAKIAMITTLKNTIWHAKNTPEVFCLLYLAYKQTVTYTAKDGKEKTCSGQDGDCGEMLYGCMEAMIIPYVINRDEDGIRELRRACSETLEQIRTPEQSTTLNTEMGHSTNTAASDHSAEKSNVMRFIRHIYIQLETDMRVGLMH